MGEGFGETDRENHPFPDEGFIEEGDTDSHASSAAAPRTAEMVVEVSRCGCMS